MVGLPCRPLGCLVPNAVCVATAVLQAFELNSAANRQRFGSAGSFEAVVKSSASFRMLLGPGCKTSLSPVEGAEDSVKVAVVAGGQTASFVFNLVKSATGQYFTDGVRIEC